MQETTTALTDPNAPSLEGIDPRLVELLTGAAENAGWKGLALDVEAAKQVDANADGSVIVRLSRDVRVNGQAHPRLRIRPIKAADIFGGTFSDEADDTTLVGSVRFAAKLCEPVGSVGEISCLQDMKAVYFATVIARGNFSSPKT